MTTPRHLPVLLGEVIEALVPAAGARIIDGTFGAGGYSRALLAAAPCRVLALDRDPDAIAAGRAMEGASDGRLVLVQAPFSRLAEVAGERDFAPVDGVVLDVGVSSMQLDQAARGFSFMADGPLDMRMSQEGPSAADLVNGAEEQEIADILFELGEERQGRRIARAIVRERERAPILTTGTLAAIVERAIGRRPGEDRHPATRTFQALRIHVNDELGELEAALIAAEHVLRPGGRLVVVSFHSLEDRIVKRFLTERSGKADRGSRHGPPSIGRAMPPRFRIVNQRPLTPSEDELASNPRARSAKLRAAERTSEPVASTDG